MVLLNHLLRRAVRRGDSVWRLDQGIVVARAGMVFITIHWNQKRMHARN